MPKKIQSKEYNILNQSLAKYIIRDRKYVTPLQSTLEYQKKPSLMLSSKDREADDIFVLAIFHINLKIQANNCGTTFEEHEG